MPKVDKRQATIHDLRIEDPELEEALQTRLDLDQMVKEWRQAGADIKKALVERHEAAINSDRDGVHSGFVICGNFRFKPRRTKVEASIVQKTVNTKEGSKWDPLEVFTLSDSAAPPVK